MKNPEIQKPKREKFGVYPKRDQKVDSSRMFVSASYYLYAKKNSFLEWDGKNFNKLKMVYFCLFSRFK